MEDLKKLYEDKKYAALERVCQKAEAAGNLNFETCLYGACAQVARSNFSRFTVEKGTELFRKAGKLSEQNGEQQKLLYILFSGELLQAVSRYKETFSSVNMTNEIVTAYRDSMRMAADALCEAAAFGEASELSDVGEGLDVISLKKAAVSCMVQLCQVRKYEVDMGKAISKRTNNAPEEIRKTYGEKYDRLTAQIREADASYVPEPIQREFVQPEEANACQLKLPPENDRTENKAEEKTEDKKKGLFARFRELF